jgi:hypothetical protein
VKRIVTPALVVFLFLLGYLGLILVRGGGAPLVFVRLGEGFRGGRPVGEEGYDGQFAYFIALDPRPAAVVAHLDVPAYRYQRLLYPLLARALALGQPGVIPWTLVLLNVAAHVAGTLMVERLLVLHGASRWYALTYGLWAGLLLAVRLDLNEPLCYALVAAGLLAHQRGRIWLSASCLGLALFAKETALLFWVALLVSEAITRRPGSWRGAVWLAAAAPFGLFQLLLLRWFGAPGLASGGYLATPFEFIPLMGLWRIGAVSLAALALFLVIFGPLMVFPSLAGLVLAARRLWARDFSHPVLALAVNGGFMLFTPSSTFREPLGLIRLAVGLVLSMILFGAYAQSRRMLNYSLFWIAALVFLRE